jgi:nucleotide-binding universal stress UspA family protein
MLASLTSPDAKNARFVFFPQAFPKGVIADPLYCRRSRVARSLLHLVRASMNILASTILAVTDLTSASYKLVGFAAFIVGPTGGEVILVSTYGGGGSRVSEPPNRVEAKLRQEGQLLESQRQWCADRGVRCRAELCEEGLWPDHVLQSAERSSVDLILVGFQPQAGADQVDTDQINRLAKDAPCPVSMVRLPPLSAF